MKKITSVLIVLSILIVSMSVSFVAYGEFDTEIIPINPVTGNTDDTNDTGDNNDPQTPTGDTNDTSDDSSGGGFVSPPLDFDNDLKDKTTTTTTKKTTTKAKVAISKCTVSGIKNKTYNAKAQSQSPTVKYGKITLKKGTDYTLSYKSNTNIGTATVIITGKGNYTGSVKKTFKINPKGTSISSLTSAKKAFTVKWKKQTTKTTGYQIQYSTDKNFKKGNTTVTVSKNKTTSKKIGSLKAKKTYYVRVRTYKTVSGTKYYSSWSASKKIKTK